jgi:hypothetical protein
MVAMFGIIELAIMLVFSLVPLAVGFVALYWIVRMAVRDGMRDAAPRREDTR